ncbi:MAG: protein translocase subunit SecD [Phycisphaera sp.]|nr:MAG: protein translocase subunit SecD [Phycisphaera sp.]
MMRNRLGWGLLAMAMLAFAFWGFMPPKEKLRLGKDLAGGVTLTYAVQIEPGQNAQDILNQLATVLGERIDPGNQMDISIVPVGRDRLEITMPLPTENVKVLRREFDAELERIRQYTIDPVRFERLMGEDAQERAASIEEISTNSPELADRLQTAAQAYDRLVAAENAYRDLLSQADPDPDALDEAEFQAADAALDYDAARDAALKLSITPAEVRRVLEFSREETRKMDTVANEPVTLPSPFQRAWDAMMARAGSGEAEGESSLQAQLKRIEASYDTYTAERRSLDDPQDLKRLLRGSGELDFRITVDANSRADETSLREELQELGPRNASPDGAVWLQLAKIESWFDTIAQSEALEADPVGFFANRGGDGFVVEPYDGQYWMLVWDQVGNRMTSAEGDWQVTRSYQGRDELGRSNIVFNMDTLGGQRLGELTREHVGDNMAVILDDRIITAPTLQGRISTNGSISGDFSPEELSDIIQILNAGALQARLSPEPISENTIGPSLGKDNLDAGLQAGIYALIAVSIFMVLYYFTYGIIAVIALGCNAALILGAMAHNQSAFTMPGIAGVVLTFGMAVDANVLIFERIREELRNGLDLSQAAKLGYQRALSAIVDGNVTNLIVCVVLVGVGTQEVKGFAITLGVGVVCTMIAALVISRLLLSVLVDDVNLKALGKPKTSMLATAIPLIDRVLEPKINWVSLRHITYAISLFAVLGSIALIITQRDRMLDTEFVGGTQVVLRFGTDDATGQQQKLARPEVLERVMEVAEAAPQGSELALLEQADIVPLDPDDDGVTSDTFQIKTLATNADDVQDALARAFEDVLDVQAAVSFAQSDETDARRAPVYPISSPTPLGTHIGQPQYRDEVDGYVGGAALVLQDITQGQTLEQLEQRIDLLRGQADFSSTLGRPREMRVLDRYDDGTVRSVVLLTIDPQTSYFGDRDRWWQDVGQLEWRVLREALTTSTTLASVSNFSPAIAQEFRGRAVFAVVISFVLITIYIWVRFGSVRYSLVALTALAHDVLIALGMIAIAELVYEFPSGAKVASSLSVLPFRIDLNTVAALLTIIGYSLNDTIIIMDRIRENRGKLPYANRRVVNLSINQTLSRTVITSGTTLFAVSVLYFMGGEGLRPFAYVLLIGVMVGTYSSVAVAAPLVWSRKADPSGGTDDAEAASGFSGSQPAPTTAQEPDQPMS